MNSLIDGSWLKEEIIELLAERTYESGKFLTIAIPRGEFEFPSDASPGHGSAINKLVSELMSDPSNGVKLDASVITHDAMREALDVVGVLILMFREHLISSFDCVLESSVPWNFMLDDWTRSQLERGWSDPFRSGGVHIGFDTADDSYCLVIHSTNLLRTPVNQSSCPSDESSLNAR